MRGAHTVSCPTWSPSPRRRTIVDWNCQLSAQPHHNKSRHSSRVTSDSPYGVAYAQGMSLAADAGAASRPKQRGWFWSALPSALVAVLVVVLSPALSGGRLRLAPLAVLPDVPPAPAPEKDASCACPVRTAQRASGTSSGANAPWVPAAAKAPDSRDAVPFSSDVRLAHGVRTGLPLVPEALPQTRAYCGARRRRGCRS